MKIVAVEDKTDPSSPPFVEIQLSEDDEKMILAHCFTPDLGAVHVVFPKFGRYELVEILED
jgi:hypothetical protein